MSKRGKTKRYSINYKYIYNVLKVRKPKKKKLKIVVVEDD